LQREPRIEATKSNSTSRQQKEKDCQRKPFDLLHPAGAVTVIPTGQSKVTIPRNRDRQGIAELKYHHRTLTMRNNSPLIVCPVDSSGFHHALTSQLLVCD
jgi:hypothetical protein